MSDPTRRSTPPTGRRLSRPRLPDAARKRAAAVRRRRTGQALTLAAIFVLVVPAAVLAQRSYLTTWSSTYPLSSSDTNASCQLCHGPDTGTLNAYGLAIFQAGPTAAGMRAVEGANSDGDPGGVSNLDEINANSQPGWTVGNSNTLYDVADGSVVASNQAPPAGIIGLLDPTPTVDLDIRSFRVERKADLNHFRRLTLRLAVESHGTNAAAGTATIVGRQGGTVVFSSAFAVTDAVGDGATTYVVRITDPSRFVPGLVTWTATLIVAGDVDGPGGDVATATTWLRGHATHRPHR